MTIPHTISQLTALHSPYGPVAKRRILWVLAIYATIASTGLVLSLCGNSLPLRIFGLGMIFPGGGFLAHANFETMLGLLHIVLTLLSMLAFVFALMVWFATGNILSPPLTWLFLAVAASSMRHAHHMQEDAPLFAGCFVVSVAILWKANHYLQQKRAVGTRAEVNGWLQETAPIIAASFGSQDTTLREYSFDDVKRMRFLLDRALQPLLDFNGFEWLDQFQTAAVRYQLNFIGYALSMAQYNYLPACGAYVTDAQRQLIQKLTDYRIWRYWVLENAWGNLRFHADPVAHENIMFSGFAATQMAMYYASSGSHEFAMPESFTLPHPSGKSWSYNLPELVELLATKADASPYHLIACEPNWIYPLCNMIGASAIKAQLPDRWERQRGRFRHHLEHEFMDVNGRFIPCRSRYTGLAFPMIGGTMPQALPCLFLNSLFPDIAMRQWLMLRKQALKGSSLNPTSFWRIDTGNYRFSRAAAYAATALAAAELGDNEMRGYCLEALDKECPMRTDNGFFYRPEASVWAHAVEFFARSSLHNGFRTLITSPHNMTDHPHISHASYPDVLIAAAHYVDGKLQVVLYNGEESGIKRITISGLKPGRHYHSNGAVCTYITADNEGNAIIPILLDGRTNFELYERG